MRGGLTQLIPKNYKVLKVHYWKSPKNHFCSEERGLDILFKDVHKKGIVTGRSYLGFSWGLGLERIIKGDGSN